MFMLFTNANIIKTGKALLGHDNVDVVLVEDLTKLLKECFVGGNVAHLVMTKVTWGENYDIGCMKV